MQSAPKSVPGVASATVSSVRVLALLSVVATGCVTPYQAKGLTGGYEQVQINDRSYEVWFHGNGYTSSSYAEQGAMRRAAELTVGRAMAGFIVSQDRTDVRVSQWQQPLNCTTSGVGGTVNTSCSGGYTNQIAKPSAHMVIYMLTGPEAFESVSRGVTVFDAGRLLGEAPLIPTAPGTVTEAIVWPPLPAHGANQSPQSAELRSSARDPVLTTQQSWTPSEILRLSPQFNPKYNSSLNPKYNSSINPEYNSSLNPKYDSSLNPKYNSSINPEYNSSLNPKYNSTINPKYNPKLNPRLSPDLMHDLPRRVAYFLFDTDGEVFGLLALGSKDCLLFMDSDGDWKGYAASDEKDGFNLFRNNDDWWAYVRPGGATGVNVFDKTSGAWIAFGIAARPDLPSP
jgi:hypothetical protein